MNKKSLMIATLSLGMAFTAGSSLADTYLHEPHRGESCEGTGYWHFVNNQTDGAAAGYINVDFDGCLDVLGHPADKVNRNNQHFDVVTDGSCTLANAVTNLPGRLVLSELACDLKKEPPPEPPK